MTQLSPEELQNQLEQMDQYIIGTIDVSLKALQKMVDAGFTGIAAKFIAKLYEDLKKEGFTEEQALDIVKSFDSAKFLGQK